MERWRWLPNDLGSFYVTANVPEFMTFALAALASAVPSLDERLRTLRPG
jgi:murein L,D-transpeptidase YcbB/YkuD